MPAAAVFGFLGLAGLRGDRVRGQRTDPQGGREPGDQVLVRDAPAQLQDIDQGPGAVAVAPGRAAGLRIMASR